MSESEEGIVTNQLNPTIFRYGSLRGEFDNDCVVISGGWETVVWVGRNCSYECRDRAQLVPSSVVISHHTPSVLVDMACGTTMSAPIELKTSARKEYSERLYYTLC